VNSRLTLLHSEYVNLMAICGVTNTFKDRTQADGANHTMLLTDVTQRKDTTRDCVIHCLTARQHRKVNLCQLQGGGKLAKDGQRDTMQNTLRYTIIIAHSASQGGIRSKSEMFKRRNANLLRSKYRLLTIVESYITTR